MKNIAEILKDCPKGMELDCTMYDNVTLIKVDGKDEVFPIRVSRGDGCPVTLTKYGQYTDADFAKCVIFPKGKITWEGFQRPFKDGDIIYIRCKNTNTFISIFKEIKDEKIYTYCDLGCNFYYSEFNVLCAKSDVKEQRFATEDEKQKLFDVLKAKGYKWNEQTKTLEKLLELKFKVGDRIQWYGTKDYRPIRTIKSIEYDRYILDNNHYINFGDEHAYKVLKFDITTFKAFDKVLVRDTNGQMWTADLFSHIIDKKPNLTKTFVCAGHYASQCIPYEDNKHLLGTTNNCDEYFKIW